MSGYMYMHIAKRIRLRKRWEASLTAASTRYDLAEIRQELEAESAHTALLRAVQSAVPKRPTSWRELLAMVRDGRPATLCECLLNMSRQSTVGESWSFAMKHYHNVAASQYEKDKLASEV